LDRVVVERKTELAGKIANEPQMIDVWYVSVMVSPSAKRID
jgi:hypothetical protein